MSIAPKRVFIVHGYQGWPQKNWFPWLTQQLAEKGVKARALTLPHPNAPELEQWLGTLEREITAPDANTYLVAHSLGCITTLQYLMRAPLHEPIGGFVLVSGFDRKIPGLSLLDGFTRDPLDFAKLQRLAPHRAVLSARDDSIVPFAYTEDLAHKLQADFYPRDHGNHFMDSDGFMSLPQVLEILQGFFAAKSYFFDQQNENRESASQRIPGFFISLSRITRCPSR